MAVTKLSDILNDRKEALLELAPNWKKRGYIALGNRVVCNKDISHGAFRLYAYLLMRCFQKDNCFPSYKKISKDISIGKRSLPRYFDELKKSGMIKAIRRGWGKTNVYILKH